MAWVLANSPSQEFWRPILRTLILSRRMDGGDRAWYLARLHAWLSPTARRYRLASIEVLRPMPGVAFAPVGFCCSASLKRKWSSRILTVLWTVLVQHHRRLTGVLRDLGRRPDLRLGRGQRITILRIHFARAMPRLSSVRRYQSRSGACARRRRRDGVAIQTASSTAVREQQPLRPDLMFAYIRDGGIYCLALMPECCLAAALSSAFRRAGGQEVLSSWRQYSCSSWRRFRQPEDCSACRSSRRLAGCCRTGNSPIFRPRGLVGTRPMLWRRKGGRLYPDCQPRQNPAAWIGGSRSFGYGVGLLSGVSSRFQPMPSGRFLEFLRAIPPPAVVPWRFLLWAMHETMTLTVVVLAADLALFS